MSTNLAELNKVEFYLKLETTIEIEQAKIEILRPNSYILDSHSEYRMK